MTTNTLNTITRVSAPEFLPLFKREYLLEWIRKNRFQRYMGAGEDMPIQFKYELLKEGGQTIQFNFLRRATSSGVGGNMLLEGREGTVSRDKCVIKADYQREAFSVAKGDEKKAIVELLPRFKPLLMNWSKERLRDRVIDACWQIVPDMCGVVPLYNPDPTRVQSGDPAAVTITSTAGASDWNNFLTNNADRFTFGNADSNWSTTLATAMGNVTASTDGFTTKAVSRMKDIAKNADPHIEPIRVGDEDEEYFIIFCDTRSFRQLQADTAMQAANQYARSREGNGWNKNPLRTGADLEWDGCIIREVPEMKPVIYDATANSGAGAWRAFVSSTDTMSSSVKGRAVLMGVNAIGVAVGQEPEFPDQLRDYSYRKGIAIEEMLGCNLIQRQDLNTPTKYVDNSVVRGVFNSVA